MSKIKSLGKDSFDNPLYDDLLIFLDQHRQEFADSEFSGWFDFEVSEVIDRFESLNANEYPEKPRIVNVTCTWQHPLVETRATGRVMDYSRKKLTHEVIGIADLTLSYLNFRLGAVHKGSVAHWQVH